MRSSYLFTLTCLVALCAPHSAHAATVIFNPQQNTVGVGSAFTVDITLDAGTAINTAGLTIAFSENLEVIDTSDGNSIIGMWIDRPVFDAAHHTLSFSGIMPGGYSGSNGKLLTLTMRAKKPGVGGIRVMLDSSQIYLNRSTPTLDTIQSHTQSIEAVAGKDTIVEPLLDTSPPESFVPELTRTPTKEGDGSWTITFDTVDKGAGIDHAEIREADVLMPWKSTWHPAASPYTLIDQSLTSRIDVRIYDKKGNVREVSVPAQSVPMRVVYTALTLFLGIIVILIIRLRKSAR